MVDLNTNTDFYKESLHRCEKAATDLAAFVTDFAKRRNNEVKSILKGETDDSPEELLYSTPHEVIYSECGTRILKFESNPEAKPLLIVPSMINRYYILDLMEDCSFAKFMRDSGLNVYILDWGIPGPDHDHLGLETYAIKWIDRAVSKVCRDSYSKNVTLMGYCMGATISAIYSARNPKKVNGFISLAAPYDFSAEDALSRMARELDVDALLGAMNGMPPELMQAGFMVAQPTSLYFKMKSLYGNADNVKRNRVYMHLERWLSDNIPFPMQAYREYIKWFYQENCFTGKGIPMGRKRVKISNIKVPVLNVIAKKDGIVPYEAAIALTEGVSSDINDLIEIEAGHIGVIMGRRAKEAWQGMLEWTRKVNSEE